MSTGINLCSLPYPLESYYWLRPLWSWPICMTDYSDFANGTPLMATGIGITHGSGLWEYSTECFDVRKLSTPPPLPKAYIVVTEINVLKHYTAGMTSQECMKRISNVSISLRVILPWLEQLTDKLNCSHFNMASIIAESVINSLRILRWAS